eukprot:CAMPEP_0183294378 /NCGR_PEP_ID=MMETSP0160_2-20130417/2750_1 /TAXON_ID=2839 ORGANISM="Odontella Sinensis, Strain Grunow 1884" /NCGR_SAMPLE_ID=MMETSP0160_2 /ASSEMBLY_ACC=CAM_ASM_000250 /LENGTH=318 /DNA_ID=CAMNT_0025455697 /DNA_START=14 /DNA_END=970 /DNA_ORIENTATION=+
MKAFALIFTLRIICFLSPCLASSSSLSAKSSPYYQSITALDKYGNSPQIRNARLASSKHGALVVAAVSDKDNTIVVCTLHTPRMGVKRCLKNEAVGVVQSHGHSLHVIAASDEATYDEIKGNSFGSAITALVCSGVKSDSNLLISLLRSHARRVWDRYDIIPSVDRVADSTSEIFLTFMGYDRSKEIMDGVGPSVEESNGDDEFSMSRPFGVQALIVGVGQGGPRQTHATLKSVDPSGVTLSWFARAMGKGSDTANKLLREKWRHNMEKEDLVVLCVEIVREVLQKELGEDFKSAHEGSEIVCETLNQHGIQVQQIPV